MMATEDRISLLKQSLGKPEAGGKKKKYFDSADWVMSKGQKNPNEQQQSQTSSSQQGQQPQPPASKGACAAST